MKSADNIQNELKKTLKATENFYIGAAADIRIKNNLLREFAAVTENSHQRYSITAGGFNIKSLIQKPMIPVIIALMLILGGTGTALAADQAAPGDALFGVDRALEQVRLNFTFGEANRARVMQEIAIERDQELQKLQSQNGETIEPARTQAQEYAGHAYQEATQALEQARLEQVQQSEQNQTRTEQQLNKVEENLEPLRQRYENQEQTQNQGEVKAIQTQEQFNPSGQATGTPNADTEPSASQNMNMNGNLNTNSAAQQINADAGANTGNYVNEPGQTQKNTP